MNIMDNWKNIFFIFPVMGYYLLESIVAAIFVNFVWRFVLEDFTGYTIGYMKWVAILWLIKVIFFDVFKLISGLSTMDNFNQNEENQENQDNEIH